MPTPLLRRRSPQREALASAIKQYDAAVAYFGRVELAHKRKNEMIYGKLYPLLEDAEATLADAKKEEGGRLVASLLAEEDGETLTQPSLADAEARVAKVQADIEQARRDRDSLAVEEERAERQVTSASIKRRDAIKGVVSSPSNVAALQDAYDAARLEMLKLRQALSVVSFAVGVDLRGNIVIDRTLPAIDPILATAWKNALTALESDADAKLPEVEG